VLGLGGVAGFCPGPACVGAGCGMPQALLFVVACLAPGMAVVQTLMTDWRQPDGWKIDVLHPPAGTGHSFGVGSALSARLVKW